MLKQSLWIPGPDLKGMGTRLGVAHMTKHTVSKIKSKCPNMYLQIKISVSSAVVVDADFIVLQFSPLTRWQFHLNFCTVGLKPPCVRNDRGSQHTCNCGSRAVILTETTLAYISP